MQLQVSKQVILISNESCCEEQLVTHYDEQFNFIDCSSKNWSNWAALVILAWLINWMVG
jgi:hypothetical protein